MIFDLQESSNVSQLNSDFVVLSPPLLIVLEKKEALYVWGLSILVLCIKYKIHLGSVF